MWLEVTVPLGRKKNLFVPFLKATEFSAWTRISGRSQWIIFFKSLVEDLGHLSARKNGYSEILSLRLLD